MERTYIAMRHLCLVSAVLFLVGCSPSPKGARKGPWSTWSPPLRSAPTPNAYEAYVKALAVKRRIDQANKGNSAVTVPATPPTERLLQSLSDAALSHRVHLYAEVLDTVRQGQKYRCQIPVPEHFGGGPGLMPFISIAEMFMLESESRLRKGDFAAAAGSALDCIRMGYDVKTQRTVIAFLVGEACERIGYRSLNRAVTRIGASQCKDLLRRLCQIEGEEVPVVDVIDGQECLARLFFKDYAGSSKSLHMLQTGQPIPLPPSGATRVDAAAIRWEQSWCAVSDYSAQLRDVSSAPYATLAARPPLPRDPLVANLMPFTSGFWLRLAYVNALSRLVTSKLAEDAYFASHRAFANDLVELVPEYLSVVPVDPFSDRPLRLRPVSGGIVLYSVGPDGSDDGGKAIQGPVRADSRGDIVVRLNRSASANRGDVHVGH